MRLARKFKNAFIDIAALRTFWLDVSAINKYGIVPNK